MDGRGAAAIEEGYKAQAGGVGSDKWPMVFGGSLLRLWGFTGTDGYNHSGISICHRSGLGGATRFR